MPEIIRMNDNCVETEFPDDATIVTIERLRDFDENYYVSYADYLMTGGIDMWAGAYIGTSDTLLEAWQRVYAYMGI